MLCYLVGMEPYYIKCIKDGPFLPKTAEGDAKPEFQWTPDERRVVIQDKRLKSIIISCLPDDIMKSVISCVSAKETWNDLVHSFQGPSNTKENRILDLKLEYQTFKAKSTESLLQTYTVYKTMLNELANDGGLRNANHTQTLDLADIYERFVYEDNLIQRRYSDTKKALITTPSSTPISTAFFSNNVIQDFQENSDDEDEEKVSDEEEVTQVKVLMALADDELTVGKSHARNGQWVDITIRKDSSNKSVSGTVTVSETKQTTPSVPTEVKDTEQESKLNELTKLVQMLIDEKVNSDQKTQESNSKIQKTESSKSVDSSKMSQDSKPKVQSTGSSKSLRPKPIQKPQLKCELCHYTNHSTDDCYRILYCMICKREDHRTSDHEMYIASQKRSLVTTEEKVQKKNDVKARSMLLMALPNEHLMTFNQYKDAKTLFAAIQTRFGGNEATKKTQKTLLKQMYENFSAPSTESLDSIFNRLQKIVSQLAILGENISQEDLNLKFLRSLPSEWNTHVVVWRNKPDLDTMSFDDLYNNFKIVEQEVKGTASSSSSSSSQNMAFVSSPSSTNEVNTAYGVSTANTQVSPTSTQVSTASTQVSTANLSDDTIYAFLASQPNGSQLVYEDLEQIHKDDIEEMDLKWQLALLSMRTRRFFQKTGRKITINGSDIVGYDKSKVECFNYHKMGHFARECRGLDWSYMVDDEVPTNMALMAFLDSEEGPQALLTLGSLYASLSFHLNHWGGLGLCVMNWKGDIRVVVEWG
ncbi:ribonuclease H-like domain-containing protein [Tanacetum coccineum]